MVQSFYMAFENSEEWEHSADWGVYCARYRFPDATIKENKVNVVGSNGVIDLSSELTGDVVFNNVQGEIDFIILRDSDFDYLAFKNKYHGKRVKVMPDNDIEHYRIGRLSIKEDNNQDVLKRVYMVLDADPFRYSVNEREYVVPINTNANQTPTKATNEDYYGENYASVSTIDGGYAINTNGDATYLRPTGIADQYKVDGVVYYRIKAYIETELTFATQANKTYFIHFDVASAYAKASGNDDMISSTRDKIFYDTSSYPSSINIFGSNSTYKYLFQSVAGEKTEVSAFVTASGEEIILRLHAVVGRLIKTSSTKLAQGALNNAFTITDLTFIELTDNIKMENQGRKAVVPTLYATEECEMIINKSFTQLNANSPKKNFDIIVDGNTVNNMVAYGDTEGTVTIKYREAYL